MLEHCSELINSSGTHLLLHTFQAWCLDTIEQILCARVTCTNKGVIFYWRGTLRGRELHLEEVYSMVKKNALTSFMVQHHVSFCGYLLRQSQNRTTHRRKEPRCVRFNRQNSQFSSISSLFLLLIHTDFSFLHEKVLNPESLKIPLAFHDSIKTLCAGT